MLIMSKLKSLPEIKINLLPIFLISCIFITGNLLKVNTLMISVMEKRPLPTLYFPIFFIICLMIPLISRYVYKANKQTINLLDSYLKLLISQILMEVTFVLLIGKGLGVIIGFLYSILLVLTLVNSVRKNRLKFPLPIKMLIVILIFMWGSNVYQIMYNRFVPLFN